VKFVENSIFHRTFGVEFKIERIRGRKKGRGGSLHPKRFIGFGNSFQVKGGKCLKHEPFPPYTVRDKKGLPNLSHKTNVAMVGGRGKRDPQKCLSGCKQTGD